MEVLIPVTAAIILGAAGCQVAHYVIMERRPWWHAFFPPTIREWIIPKCPFCWPARAMVAACLVAMLAV